MDNEDYEIEDLISNLNKSSKKRKNSKKKGGRGENTLCKVLKKRFNYPFSRVVGSGNRWSQTNLSEEAKRLLTGDVVVPSNFKFCIECKHGYSELDLCNVLDNKTKILDDFIEQAVRDAGRINRTPIVCWKKDYCSWIVFVKKEDFATAAGFKKFEHNIIDFGVYLCYNDWIGISLENFLKQEDSFFFE